ncbi:Anti-sigma-B factor antagonist [Nonomuraea coxensis DSM 45129]|uniref:Anti-sigma factor antagonist n=1 Tax=Nonomuraea coxensis DSM 45129 TaxID=1122611 RepID=A0ABX8U3T8_9ACTN|nr:STAS domain-containing protein [Nonomuraea coxensis]QYC42415.1 Anti-sigma-B factor antagonist [Nonomuraea coxensis DSM 45129]
MTALAIEVVRRSGYWLLTLRGELDRQTQPDLSRAFDELFGGARGDKECPHVVCDLGGLDFCDSSGLRALVVAQERARERGGGLRLVEVNPSMAALLEITLLEEQLPAYDDLDHATRELTRPE